MNAIRNTEIVNNMYGNSLHMHISIMNFNYKHHKMVLRGWGTVTYTFPDFPWIFDHFSTDLCNFSVLFLHGNLILCWDLSFSSNFTSIIMVWKIFFIHFYLSVVEKTQNTKNCVKTIIYKIKKELLLIYIYKQKWVSLYFKIQYPMVNFSRNTNLHQNQSQSKTLAESWPTVAKRM